MMITTSKALKIESLPKFGALMLFVAALGIAIPVWASSVMMLANGNQVPTLADVVDKVQPGIVNISTLGMRGNFRGNRPSRHFREYFEDDFFKRFFRFDGDDEYDFEGAPPRELSEGSGVIINAKRGYVLTNHHILTGASKVIVKLLDGRKTEAEILGTDPGMDVALLQIDLDNLVEVELGDSNELRVGDFVLAFGNNFGLSSTVTSGIVSALGRSNLGFDKYGEFIQTDAAINRGSSGGALVNLRGEVIGINTAILTPDGGNIGIAFAIPINTAASVVSQLIEFGKVQRGILGIHFQEISEEIAKAFDLRNTEGVLVTRVLPKSGAEQVGLREGDVLVALNGNRIRDGAQLRTKVALIRTGETVEVEYIRENKFMRGTGVISEPGRVQISGRNLIPKLEGAEFREANASESPAGGIVVVSVERASSAWYAGIRAGDVILEVNRKPVSNIDTFNKTVKENSNLLMMKLIRDGQARYMVFS